MANAASRLITLIMLLQNRTNQKAGELAKKLGVSVRTLHRYLAMLDEMGIPICSERGPYGGFSLMRGYKIPPLMFTPEEAVAIYLGVSLVEEIWGRLYRDASRGVLAKLDNLLPNEQRSEVNWAGRSLVTMGLHHASLDSRVPILEKLRLAIRESRQVDMLYQSVSSQEASRRIVEPYALALRWGWWYVVGHCHRRREVRTFRVDRIEEIDLLGEIFEPPKDFDARSFLAKDFQGSPQVQAKIRFRAQHARLARLNRPYWDFLDDQPDGSVIAGLSAPDMNWAVSSVLAYGPIVEVLEPLELRDRLREAAQAIAGLYNAQGNHHG